MSRNYKFHNPESLYFVSFIHNFFIFIKEFMHPLRSSAVVDWLDACLIGRQVFTRNEYKDIVLDSLTYCQKQKGMEIIAWCIMTNHTCPELSRMDSSYI